MRKPVTISFFGALAMLATSVPAIVISATPQAAKAQTQGMERRDERRGTRQDARDAKQACKAGDESRAECRQMKRDMKQDGRQNDGAAAAPTTQDAAAPSPAAQ